MKVFKIIGVKLLNRYLKRVARKIPINCEKAVNNVANHIHNKSMINLQGSLGTSLTSEKYGHSEQISIEDSMIISSFHTPDKAEAKLQYNSPHAFIVEYGGLGRVVSSDTTPFAIGKSQGREPIYRQSFRLQRGYHYLDNAVEDKSTKRYFDEQTERAIRKSIRRLF